MLLLVVTLLQRPCWQPPPHQTCQSHLRQAQQRLLLLLGQQQSLQLQGRWRLHQNQRTQEQCLTPLLLLLVLWHQSRQRLELLPLPGHLRCCSVQQQQQCLRLLEWHQTTVLRSVQQQQGRWRQPLRLRTSCRCCPQTRN